MARNDGNIITVQNPGTIDDGAGDDRYVLSNDTVQAGAEITILDAEGNDTIQLIDGLEIASSEVAADAVKLTLTNGAEITILQALNFTFEIGGNPLTGEDGTNQTFAEFTANTLDAAGGAVTIGQNPTDPTGDEIFAIAADAADVEEGNTATFTVTTENVADGTEVAYTISGVDAADVAGDLTGTATVNNNTATISVTTVKDKVIDRDETLTVSLDGKDGATASTTVKDYGFFIEGDTELAAANLSDLQGATDKINIFDVASSVTVNYDASTITGTDDHVQITIGEVPTTASGATVSLSLTEGALATASIEQVTLSSNEFDGVTANTLAALSVNPTALTTLNINGAADLAVTAALDAGISTLNAADHTGALNLNLTASTAAVDYDGSQGVDTVTFNGTANNNNINLGTGDDTLTTGNGADEINGGAGVDLIIMDPSELDISDSINGGAGVDTIRITGKDDIQRTETLNVQSVETFDLEAGGTHFVVTDNLVDGGDAGLEAGSSFTIDTRSATDGHTIDLTDISKPSGFALQGNATTDDLVLIKDVQIASGLNLAFDSISAADLAAAGVAAGAGDGDVLRVIDGATISGADFNGITGLETLVLASDSTQPQEWTLEIPDSQNGLIITIDPTVPQNSIVNIVSQLTGTNTVTVNGNSNVTVNTTGTGVTVATALEFTENADVLNGTALVVDANGNVLQSGDDNFHASTPDQVQVLDVANGNTDTITGTLTGVIASTAGVTPVGDTLTLDFALPATGSALVQLGSPNITNIENLVLNTANANAFTAAGSFVNYTTLGGNDSVIGHTTVVATSAVDGVYNLGEGNNTYTTRASIVESVTTGAGNDTFVFAEDAHQDTVDAAAPAGVDIDAWETGAGTDTLRYQDGVADGIAVAQGSIATLIQTAGTLDKVTVNSGANVTSIAFNDTDAADFANNTVVAEAEVITNDQGVLQNGSILFNGASLVTGTLNATGANGADILLGGTSNDTLVGDAPDPTATDDALGGNDQLLGGSGADTLTGGDGSDSFTYINAGDGALTGQGSGADVITDFVSGTDLFAIAATATAGSLASVIDTDGVAGLNLVSTNNNALSIGTTELAVYTTANNGGITDADLTTDGFATVLSHLNNILASANGAENALIALQGVSNTGVYFYQENTSDNIVDATEIRLLAVAENALLTATDFTLF